MKHMNVFLEITELDKQMEKWIFYHPAIRPDCAKYPAEYRIVSGIVRDARDFDESTFPGVTINADTEH